MISNKLSATFQIMEAAMFPVWQKASPEERDRIVKDLGQAQGRMIIEEIDREVAKLKP